MPELGADTLARYRMAVRACAVMNLRQAARAVTAQFDAHLRSTGLRATQLNLLMAVETGAAKTITDLAEILAMDRTTMTRNMKLLRDRGLVKPGQIRLTAKGRRSAAIALPLWEEAQARFLESLGRQRWESLSDELAAAKASIRTRSRPTSGSIKGARRHRNL